MVRSFIAIVGFELRYYLKRISTHVYFLLFFSLGVLCTCIVGGAFKSVVAAVGGAGGIVHANAPSVVAEFTGALGLFAVLVVTAIMGNAIFRDYEARIHPLFFTTPVGKATFLAGRFFGAFLVNAWIFLSIPLGLMAGLLIPSLMEDRIGPFRLASYAHPYLVLLLPTLFFTGAIFFALAALTRQMLPNYLGGVMLLVGYLLAGSLLGDIENKTLAALVDPFGMSAFGVVAEYWTAAEQNTRLMPVVSLIGINRLIWMSVGLLILVVCSWRLRFTHSGRGRGLTFMELLDRHRSPEPAGADVGLGVSLRLPVVARDFSVRMQFRQFWAVLKRSMGTMVLNRYFPGIAVAGLLFLILSAGQVGKIYGTPTWPMTYEVLELLGGTFALFTVIIITFYAGELVWQERDLEVDQVMDALPAPGWTSFLGKLAGLVLVVASLQVVVMIAGIVTQLARGFHDIDVLLYLRVLFGLNLLDFVLTCVLAFAVHVLVNQKYVGHVVMVLTYFVFGFMGTLGFEHNLYRYGSDPGWRWSDMNEFGPFMEGVFWFRVYWFAVALGLAVLVNVLWVRGREGQVTTRLTLARRRLSGPARAFAVASVVLALGIGGWIFYNTNVRNEYRTSEEVEEMVADYERLYKKYQGLPQPRIVSVSIDVDLHPQEGTAEFAGTYRMINKTSTPITDLHVQIPGEADIRLLELSVPSKATLDDEDHGYHIRTLDTPLEPGAELECRFDVAYTREGFENGAPGTAVVRNGTFVNSGVLPSFGYDERGEISDDDARKKRDLPPRERMHSIDDVAARSNNYISHDADWIDFKATVTTDPDQIALAPGYLKSDTMVDGRRRFEYEMDRPILNFYAFLSARYAVKKDEWNGLPLEIYYHPGHEYNLERMFEATKRGLDYYTANFGPYQHRQVRIVEFPRYATFAQSFPNTIPFSEGIGFVARLDDDTRIDYPFYVTAHEVAHQWWAHQVIGADVQGATLLSESMSQYSALMVMEHELGKDQMRRFLKHELNSYLIGRSSERKKEQPLALNENQQYIHYNKGSVVMYAMRDYLGEDVLNGAIKGYLDRVKYQDPPYTISTELVDAIRAVTPPELPTLVDDMFMKITLWDLRSKDATVLATADGKWSVTLTYEARKYYADETGNQTEAALDMPIDVGVFSEGDSSKEDDDVPLHLEKHRITSGEGSITVVVDQKPVRAGLDPYHKLIDRRSDDNAVSVKEGKPPAS